MRQTSRRMPTHKLPLSRRARPSKQDADTPTEPARGRPRDSRLDAAILAVAERQLRETGFTGMSLASVAREAETTVPSLRRRYRDKSTLAAAVVDSIRVEAPREGSGPPRDRALAVLENFGRNLERLHSMALLGTLLAEEHRTPELLTRFRSRLVRPRRRLLAEALEAGVRAEELASSTDTDVAVNMLIGSFYAIYVSHGQIPQDWPQRALNLIWPQE
jgi:AcrR family transcriptional regulator